MNQQILASGNRDELLKSHFLILALKFHPDKNKPTLNKQCTELMQVVNQSYYCLLNKTVNPNIVISEGRLYSLLNPNNISCAFTDSYSIFV